MGSNADKHGMKSAAKREPHEPHDHHDHHAHMAADFRKRFWISFALTLPILLLLPLLQKLVGLREAIRFSGDLYVLFGLSSAVFWYGGWPFLKGFFEELKSRRPGMMTLISVAVATAYLYSSAVVFGLTGKMFFWELAALADIMLLGHWIEMKSVMGASKALEELAKLMPSDAHKLMLDGSVKDMPLNELAVDKKAANEDMIAAATSRATGRVIHPDEELMMARSVWRVERTTLERKVPPRAELTIEGATA